LAAFGVEILMRFVMVLTTAGQPVEAISSAVEFAASNKAELTVVFILDETVPSAIFEKLTDIGFIGEKPGTELESAVSAEYRRQAEETLDEVRRVADNIGIAVATEIVSGDFVDRSLEVVAKHAADMLIVARSRQSWLSRLLTRTGVDDLVRRAPCEIKVFEA
jgi:nucleotide-binding universal stress UspA family protein